MSLKKKKSQGKAVEMTVNRRRKTLKIFVWISSENSASVLVQHILTVGRRNPSSM
jgi:hypothetical protein